MAYQPRGYFRAFIYLTNPTYAKKWRVAWNWLKKNPSYKFLAYAFWVGLSIVFLGIGLIGYPIATILYGIVLLVVGSIGLWSKKHKKGFKLFTLPFFKEIYGNDCYNHTRTDTNKPNSNIPNFSEDAKCQASNNHSYSKDENPKHHKPPFRDLFSRFYKKQSQEYSLIGIHEGYVSRWNSVSKVWIPLEPHLKKTSHVIISANHLFDPQQ